MHRADIFVILDDVQYTYRDWRNRNRIKTPDSVIWLTVPVKAGTACGKLIKDVRIENSRHWQKKHLKSIECFYRKGVYSGEIMEILNGLYNRNHHFLIDIDMEFILKAKEYLSIGSKLVFSSEIPCSGKKDDKILSICKYLGAGRYLTGNAARNYLRESIFAKEGIEVAWHNYRHPYYRQFWTKETGFISHLSVIDLLFNHGKESLDILTGKRSIARPEGIMVRHADEVQALGSRTPRVFLK